MQDVTVQADEEGSPRGKAARTKNPVSACDLSVGIAQNGIIDAQRLGKLAVGFDIVHADSVVTGLEGPDGGSAPTHCLTLDRASARERLRKPGEDDRFAPD